MVVPHGGVLWPGALWRRRLVPHALVPVGRLRHLAARGQLAPGQLPAARAQAASVEAAARAAQVSVLHAGRHTGYLRDMCEDLALINIRFKTSRRAPRRAGRVRLVCEGAKAHSHIIG